MQKILTLIVASFLLSGCMWVHKMDIEQGNIITPDMVSRLHPGMTQQQVKDVMGTPILMNTFDENRVDYVYTFKPGGGKTSEKCITLIFRKGRLQAMENTDYPAATH